MLVDDFQCQSGNRIVKGASDIPEFKMADPDSAKQSPELAIAENYKIRGRVLHGLGAFDLAENSFHRACQLQTDRAERERLDSWRATKLAMFGKSDLSLSLNDELVRESSATANDWMLHAGSLTAVGALYDAAEACTHAIECNPKMAIACCHRG